MNIKIQCITERGWYKVSEVKIKHFFSLLSLRIGKQLIEKYDVNWKGEFSDAHFCISEVDLHHSHTIM